MFRIYSHAMETSLSSVFLSSNAFFFAFMIASFSSVSHRNSSSALSACFLDRTNRSWIVSSWSLISSLVAIWSLVSWVIGSKFKSRTIEWCPRTVALVSWSPIVFAWGIICTSHILVLMSTSTDLCSSLPSSVVLSTAFVSVYSSCVT